MSPVDKSFNAASCLGHSTQGKLLRGRVAYTAVRTYHTGQLSEHQLWEGRVLCVQQSGKLVTSGINRSGFYDRLFIDEKNGCRRTAPCRSHEVSVG